MKKRVRAAEAGFTLVEMMVTIAILGILIAIPAANMVLSRDFQALPNTKEEIMSDIQHCRTLAVRLEETCTINFFTPNPNQYTVTVSNTAINRVVTLTDFSGTLSFDPNDPQGVSPPVGSMTFLQRGFAAPPAGSIYLRSTANQNIYRIRTTLAGIVDSAVWNVTSGTWDE